MAAGTAVLAGTREMSVLVGIVDAGTAVEVAARIRLTANTLKAHLRAIFAETDVFRQAELVKLAAGFTGPIDEAQERRTR